jgi:hypothetical protein
LQGSDPTIRAFFQRLDRLRRELQPGHLLEIPHDLFAGKAQIVGAQFEYAALGAQEGQIHFGLAAAGDDHVQVGWRVFEREVESL